MNRREFLALSSTAGLGMLASSHVLGTGGAWAGGEAEEPGQLMVLPYPQEVVPAAGVLRLGKPDFLTAGAPSRTREIAQDCLQRFLPRAGGKLVVRLRSLEEGYDRSWLSSDEAELLASERTSPEASVLRVTRRGVVAVGKGTWGMLWAVQTLCQTLVESRRQGRDSVLCARIKDWPDLRWQCLAPTLTWYSGWNRLESYDLCNWSEGQRRERMPPQSRDG